MRKDFCVFILSYKRANNVYTIKSLADSNYTGDWYIVLGNDDPTIEEYIELYGKDNVKRQYKSELYPFACDFYIISEDLYIEYNGMWTHGHTPYIGSKENEIQLEKWKQKAETSDYYKSAIVTWTISDVKKRNTAKENNLNYIEIWNILDINNYFKI